MNIEKARAQRNSHEHDASVSAYLVSTPRNNCTPYRFIS